MTDGWRNKIDFIPGPDVSPRILGLEEVRRMVGEITGGRDLPKIDTPGLVATPDVQWRALMTAAYARAIELALAGLPSPLPHPETMNEGRDDGRESRSGDGSRLQR